MRLKPAHSSDRELFSRESKPQSYFLEHSLPPEKDPDTSVNADKCQLSRQGPTSIFGAVGFLWREKLPSRVEAMNGANS